MNAREKLIISCPIDLKNIFMAGEKRLRETASMLEETDKNKEIVDEKKLLGMRNCKFI